MSVDIEAIEARVNAAAPGPWVYVDNGFDGYIMSASEYLIVGGEPAEGRIEPDDPNADFIAHSREDIPALLAEVKRLTDEIAAITAERDAAVNDLRGKCQYCARQPMRRLSGGQLYALCATCQEYNKCNWKYRGAGKEQKHG